MSSSLADLLPDASEPGRIRVWLKSAEYTTRLLTGDGGDPWQTPALYLAYFSQAHGLLRPDVAVVEVSGLYASWLARHPAYLDEMGAKRRFAFPIRKLLEAEEPRAILAEVLDGVAGYLRGQVPLVLALPSPRHWVQIANRAVGREEAEFDADGVEDCAMYMADMLRSVSQAKLAGLLLEELPDDADCGPLDIERYRPLINVARHYRWGVSILLGSAPPAAMPSATDVDALIGAASDLAGAPCATGIDVSDALWAGEAPPPLGARQFYFARIPKTQHPEQVLESIALLRSA
ncbi:hypothetical protein G3580_01420 [Nitrogeniibacter mangrovi]|uniref:Uncharacterized protein n=1 Tax=Nitrogeniibacter mangrovi TaxID=2016596 RepID=A0A6C1AYG2_9RHOO|nr:hypothetical protein [Nitrogeniibacter mangrovi]QID16401.1 hypothetical protein G3580_01420 [Nitrogeniibacter mangrovi]